ncbi:MAG: DUF916 and DUF3324 domain-containing protein [Lactobacillaceae bacterium]|jgi:hypothetical protein|nr:DUF916 and DUF3324 domain-containing protein [Lactobacillaceae bacterium]
MERRLKGIGMQKFIKYLLLIMVTIIGLSMGELVSANQLSFSVVPVLPDNQVDKKDGFYNLVLQPGESQDVTLRYSNSTKKPVTVTTKVAPATTNINGVVEYGTNKSKIDRTLKYNLKDLLTVQPNVTIQPGETKDVIVHVTMPEQHVEGIIAGGLTFSDQAADKAAKTNKSSTMAIKNIYGFQLGFLIRQSIPNPYSDAKINHDGLKLSKIQANQVNYRNAISMNLQNPLAVYVNQMAVSAKIFDANGKKVLYSSKDNMMQMAPNSNFDYSVMLGNGKKLNPGTYRLKLTAYALKDVNGKYKTKLFNKQGDQYKYRWQFNRKFTISGAVAKKYNAKDVTIKHFDWLKLLMIVAIVLALLGGLLWFILWKRLKDDELVEIEEDVRDVEGKLVTVMRKVSEREYKRLLKQGKHVRLIKKVK